MAEAPAVPLSACPACKRGVVHHDDFVHLRGTLYHLSCLMTALRDLGQDGAGRAASVRNGIDAVRNGNGRPSPSAGTYG